MPWLISKFCNGYPYRLAQQERDLSTAWNNFIVRPQAQPLHRTAREASSAEVCVASKGFFGIFSFHVLK